MATKVPNGGGGSGGGSSDSVVWFDIYVDDPHALGNGVRDGATVSLAAHWNETGVTSPAWQIKGPAGETIDPVSLTCEADWKARTCASFVAAQPGTYTIVLTATWQHKPNDYLRKLVVTAISTLQTITGRVTYLRAHDVGTLYGPSSDQIDVEAVVKLEGSDLAFGLQLRPDANQVARRAMFDLLRDAYANDWRVTLDYSIVDLKKNGVIMRVALAK